jgi:hypothetical protein
MFLKLKKIVAGAAGVALVAAWFAYGGLEQGFVTYPRAPDPAEGRTVPHAVKGIVVYITKAENNLLSWLIWIMIGSGVVGGVVTLIHRGDPFKSKE